MELAVKRRRDNGLAPVRWHRDGRWSAGAEMGSSSRQSASVGVPARKKERAIARRFSLSWVTSPLTMDWTCQLVLPDYPEKSPSELESES